MSNLLEFRPPVRKRSGSIRRHEISASGAYPEAVQGIASIFFSARAKVRISDAIALLQQSHLQIRGNIKRVANLAVRSRLEADLESLEQQLEFVKSETSRL